MDMSCVLIANVGGGFESNDRYIKCADIHKNVIPNYCHSLEEKSEYKTK